MPEKRYTTCCTERQLALVAVGMIFYDHGKKMRLTRVGDPYVDADWGRVFDAWAVPEGVVECPSTTK